MAEQSHFLSFSLAEWGKNTSAHWAVSPARRALVFVHGFGGKSISTWSDFSGLLHEQPACSGDDIIFFGYDGLYAQAEFSATLLFRFLDRLFGDPLSIVNTTINPKAQRASEFDYQSIVLVAHSLGAIICRRALLIAHEQAKDWVNKTGMVLFAPAHCGAHITRLPQILTWPMSVAWALFEAKVQVIEDLKPGSDMLKTLLEETNKVISSGNGKFAVARRVIWAEKDNIVIQNRFASDPVAITYLKRGHTELCKPSARFFEPIKDVIEAL